MKALLQPVNHCQAHNIVHSDIMPDRIIITENNTVRLIASALRDSKENLSKVLGNIDHLAPEVINGSYG